MKPEGGEHLGPSPENLKSNNKRIPNEHTETQHFSARISSRTPDSSNKTTAPVVYNTSNTESNNTPNNAPSCSERAEPEYTQFNNLKSLNDLQA